MKRAQHPEYSGGEAKLYRVFGLTVASEWELPLRPARKDAIPDVQIRSSRIEEGPAGLSETSRGSLLSIPAVGRYLISGGKLIEIEALPGVSARNLRLYMLGSAFGALLHQRGTLPLHANAIDVGGAAVLFMGHSGAGKSTLAAWFHDHGYPVLADDISTVHVADGIGWTHPGIPRLRLWKDALEHLGRTTSCYEMSFDDYDKYDVPTDVEVWDQPVPLLAIYHLAAKTADTTPSIERLRGVRALDALVANTYRGSFLSTPPGIAQHMAQCLELSRQIPVFQISRPWDLGILDAVNETLRDHALSILDVSQAAGDHKNSYATKMQSPGG